MKIHHLIALGILLGGTALAQIPPSKANQKAVEQPPPIHPVRTPTPLPPPMPPGAVPGAISDAVKQTPQAANLKQANALLSAQADLITVLEKKVKDQTELIALMEKQVAELKDEIAALKK